MTVDVAGVGVVDLPQSEVIIRAAEPPGNAPRFVLALHVGGLLALRDRQFVQSLNSADLVYADGAAVVLLARSGGAKDIARAATTDIGIPILQELAAQLGRPARIALLGGPPGLAEEAARALETRAPVKVTSALHGYFEDDAHVLHQLRDSAPDLVLVGMGMPKEALWTHRHRAELPPAIIMTCGGWFGFLTGAEQRAPAALQSSGMEWAFRLSQDFGRLWSRYLRGAFLVAYLLPGQLSHRRRRASRSRPSGRFAEVQAHSKRPDRQPQEQ